MRIADGPAMPQPKRALADAERLDWLRLIRTENVGPITFRNLMARFNTAGAALTALPDLARRGGRTKPLKPAGKAEAERELAALHKAGAELIAMVEPDYPPLLAAIDDAPPLIAVRGHRHLLTRDMVAMVGARNASLNGRRFAQKMAAELGRAGYVVASGLARGIDAAAHEASLESGTVAVMAGGVDVIYPPENAALGTRIGREGVLVSECPMGTEPTGRHFPKRNRLIAGLARGVVLIEAASRSGSLITARYALDQGREVMACPGSPEDPRCSGCNALIRDGAALVRNAQDVADALAAPSGIPGAAEDGAEFTYDADIFLDGEDDPFAGMADFDPDGGEQDMALAEQVMRLLGPTPVEPDELARACGASPSELSLVLLELDIAGRITITDGGRIALGGPPD
jgi:DNA processing protein